MTVMEARETYNEVLQTAWALKKAGMTVKDKTGANMTMQEVVGFLFVSEMCSPAEVENFTALAEI